MTILRKNSGNALIIVILILAVIFVAGIYFGFHTSGVTRNTERAIGGDQTASLADAGLNRVMRIVAAEMNDDKAFDPTSPKDKMAVILRYPLPLLEKGDNNKLASELGDDPQLDVSVLDKEGLQSKFEYTKEDLIKDDKNGILEEFVNYASFDKAKEWDLKVTVEIESAYKISAKTESGEEYQVPGVDVAFTGPASIKEFLENKGIPNIIFEFPDTIKLLDFSIPFTLNIPILGPVEIAKIDPIQFIDYFVKPATKGTDLAGAFDMRDSGMGLGDISKVHNLMHALFNKLLSLPDVYPIKFSSHDSGDFFLKPDKLWPSGVKLPKDMSRYVEKYGTIRVTSDAEITFANGTTSKRRCSATKDFKVSDIMPMAPVYSFFIANTGNDCINFNDRGGQLYVNNNAKRLFSKAEITKNKEHSGQIRVNYLPDDAAGGSTNCPLVINVSLIGDTDGPKLANNKLGDGMLNVAAGNDASLMLGSTKTMAITNAKYNMDWTINANTQKKKNAEGKKVPTSVKLSPGKFNRGFQMDNKILKNTDLLNKKPTYLQNRDAYNKGGLKKYHDSQRLWNQEDFRLGKFDDKLDGLAKWKKEKTILNFLPDVEKTSSNIFGFGAAMIKRPFGMTTPNLESVGITFGSGAGSNSFLEYELPYMGTANSNYCLPTLGVGQNKTHLFGTSAWNPTLTRDIEGAVAKRYRQWRATVLGLLARDRLPLLPFLTPPWCNVPAIPIPYWWVDTVINKYDYQIFCLKPFDVETNKTDTTYSIYDPAQMENMPANWYSNEQFAKKSNYFYVDYQSFIDDLPNRVIEVGGKKALQLNGVTYISGSLGSEKEKEGFRPDDKDTFYVTGKGMIVCSGNIILNCNIMHLNVDDEQTVFSLISRNGGLVLAEKGEFTIQGSIYTNRAIYLGSNTKLNIQGNWVTNEYARHRMMGDILIDYVSSYLRPSMGSLHPETGKYDPRRYNLAMAQKWNAWRVD